MCDIVWSNLAFGTVKVKKKNEQSCVRDGKYMSRHIIKEKLYQSII